MSSYCQHLKKLSSQGKYIVKISKQQFQQALEIYEMYKYTYFHDPMYEQLCYYHSSFLYNFQLYTQARNKYNHQVRRESNAGFKDLFAQNKNN